jgi:hypothetical protein
MVNWHRCVIKTACGGLCIGCIGIVLIAIQSTRLPSSLSPNEMIDPATRQPYPIEIQRELLWNKTEQSDAWKGLLVGASFIIVGIFSCAVGVLWCHITVHERRAVAPIIPPQEPSLHATDPPLTPISPTNRDPPQTSEPNPPQTQLESVVVRFAGQMT